MRTVVAVIKNNNNEYLICQRSENDVMGLYWEFPGGKIEKGETEEIALVREMEEELDVQIKICKRLISVKHKYSFGFHEIIAYEAILLGSFPQRKVHNAISWKSLDKIDSSSLCPPDAKILEFLKSKDSVDHVNPKKKSINLVLADIIIHSYYISLVWILKRILKNKARQDNMVMQNITDVYIHVRYLIPTVFIIFNVKNWIATAVCIYLIFEMTIAHLSHFLSNKFNASGSGKVTAVRRTVIIIFINFFSFVILFAYFYSLILNYGLFDLFYYSLSIITSPGFDKNLPSLNKILITLEGTIGLFYVGYIVATIISWSKVREES